MNEGRGPISPLHRAAMVAALLGFLALSPALRPLALGLAVAGAAGVGALRTLARRRAHARAEAQSGSLVLGHDPRGGPVVLADRQLAAHGLILGASGAGKSTTLLAILVAHIRRGLPVVAIDLKGSPEFARALADAAREAGRPFWLWSPDGPAHWNPLRHGNPTELKDKLIATERFTEPHYQRAAERYVQLALTVLARVHPARAPTLEEVVEVMDPAKLLGLVQAGPAGRALPLADYLTTLTRDQLSAIRGLGTRLAIVSESHIGAFLRPGGPGESIDVRAALDGHGVLLFSLNSSRYGQLSAQLGTMAVQDLIAAVGERLTRPAGAPRALVGIDEFSALGADHIINLLARGREAGVSVIVATQELADLDRAARGLREQVLGNTAFKLVHRQDVPRSAETVAELVGTRWVWERTYRTHRTVFGDGCRRGDGTKKQVEEYLVHPNEIKRLRTGEAIVITKTPVAQARRVRVSPARSRDGVER